MVQIGANSRHDPFGRRIAKTVKQGGQTKTTYDIDSEQGLMAKADEKGANDQGLWLHPGSGPAGPVEHRPGVAS